MLNGRNLCLDTMSEVYDLLRPWADLEFWDFDSHDPVPDSIYVLGRQQVVECQEKVRKLCQDRRFWIVFGNSAEGSQTLIDMCARVFNFSQEIKNGSLLLISGGDLPKEYVHMTHEHFLVRVLDYQENLVEIDKYAGSYRHDSKPYKFLFLNGRARSHRKYLIERLKALGLLGQALWTMLDGRGSERRHFNHPAMGEPNDIRVLPTRYEVPRYACYKKDNDYPHQFVKPQLFLNEWGDIYLHARPYLDSYFSLVTETVFEIPCSFRTEKIAKPLAMGHPWICAANRGYYRDLRQLGFRTFGGIIDESFDQIDHHQDRMDRLIAVVTDLCQQDLASFAREAQAVCKYNQQFLPEFVQRHRTEFPSRFQQFISQHARS